jgi:hypothetical protein
VFFLPVALSTDSGCCCLVVVVSVVVGLSLCSDPLGEGWIFPRIVNEYISDDHPVVGHLQRTPHKRQGEVNEEEVKEVVDVDLEW